MALAKPVRSLVNRAMARGAVYEDGMLKKPDGTVIVGVPQDHDVKFEKLKQFQLAVGLSGVLDWPLMNGHRDEPEEPDDPPEAASAEPEPAPSTDPDEELTTVQAAQLLGVTPGAVHMATSNGKLTPSFKLPGRRGGNYYRRRDVEEYARTRRPGGGHRGPRPAAPAPRPAPDAAALVASVGPKPAAGATTRYDVTTPSGRLSAGVAQVRSAHKKLDAALTDLMQGLDAIEAESTGMLQELSEGRAKVRKVEQMIGRVVDVL